MLDLDKMIKEAAVIYKNCVLNEIANKDGKALRDLQEIVNRWSDGQNT